MIKRIFEAVEGMFRAVIYMLILLMGVMIAGLGAYTVLFLTIRIAQFLWQAFFRNKWL